MRLPVEAYVGYIADFVSGAESAELLEWVPRNCPDLFSEDIHLGDGGVHRAEIGKWMFVDQELTDYRLFPEAFGRRMEWPPLVAAIRDRVEHYTGMQFSVCVCLYYRNGEEGIGFHTDLPAFGPTSLIPSISLGERREFLLRRISAPSDLYSIDLDSGSLLIMGNGCQEKYEHSLPVNQKYRQPRINLTFRQFDWPAGLRPSRVSE